MFTSSSLLNFFFPACLFHHSSLPPIPRWPLSHDLSQFHHFHSQFLHWQKLPFWCFLIVYVMHTVQMVFKSHEYFKTVLDRTVSAFVMHLLLGGCSSLSFWAKSELTVPHWSFASSKSWILIKWSFNQNTSFWQPGTGQAVFSLEFLLGFRHWI